MTTRFFLTFLALALAPLRSPAQTCVNEQVTEAPGGGPLDFDSTQPRISSDGRFVAFQTQSTNTGWTTLLAQVYVVDRDSGALDLVSQSSSGTPAVHVPFTSSQYTNALGVSTDGRFVLFYTEAGNLVSNDTNTQPQGGLALLGVDVFLRDRLTGQTLTPNRMPNGTTGTGHSPHGAMSSDGRYVAFTSYNPLVPGDGNAEADAYLFDRVAGTTQWVGLTSAGGAPNAGVGVSALSADGRYVVLTTVATNMVPAPDTNNRADVFVRDLATGSVERVSLDSNGIEGNEHSSGRGISADGRLVLFESTSTNWLNQTYPLPDLFVRDRAAGTTTLASVRENGAPVDDRIDGSTISADGRYVLFVSDGPGIVGIDTLLKDDVFLRDLVAGQTHLVSRKADGGLPGAHSSTADLSADGRFIAFSSKSNQLTVPAVFNGVEDVFVRECVPTGPKVYCVAVPTSSGCAPTVGSSGTPSASAGSGFDVALSTTRNQKPALLFYGTAGSTLAPFLGQWMCVRDPRKRTALQSTGGSPVGDDCTGSAHFDFNARIASGVDPALAAGAEVWAQYWTRDPGSTSGTHLSNALWFPILP